MARFVVWVNWKLRYQIIHTRMKFIVGEKTGMTQVFSEDGVCQAATVVKVAPAKVAQVKTKETDGYEAVQLAYGEQKEHRVNKANKGHFKQAAAGAREYRPKAWSEDSVAEVEPGTTVDVSSFAPGDSITVSAVSKGKGFQGVVKRHGFKGGRRTHGQKHSEREPGSIGQTGINRVLKGMRMAGRMGGETVTVKGLKVLQVNPEENLLVVSGAVPGRKGTLVEVYGS
jgi:large subunit ribosomal protein L3